MDLTCSADSMGELVDIEIWRNRAGMHFGDELAHNPTMLSLEAQVGTDNLLDQSCDICLLCCQTIP